MTVRQAMKTLWKSIPIIFLSLTVTTVKNSVIRLIQAKHLLQAETGVKKAFQTISFFIGVKAMIHGQTTKTGAFQMKWARMLLTVPMRLRQAVIRLLLFIFPVLLQPTKTVSKWEKKAQLISPAVRLPKSISSIMQWTAKLITTQCQTVVL